MTLDVDREPTSECTGLESFFPLLSTTTSGFKGRVDQSKQKKISKRNEKPLKKTILIQRRSFNSDIWICNSCTLTGDRWFMEKHPCKQNVRNNFAKAIQRFQEY